MAFQIVINLIIAFMWMFLSETYTGTSFFLGFVLGLILLLLLDRFVPGRFYLHRVIKIIQLILLFIRELITSTLDIAKLVYKPNLNVEPGIFSYPLEVSSDWEITLLSNLISLTPGTLTVAVSHDNKKIFIHAMHIDDTEDSIHSIKNTFERAIMEVTR